ncbi:unnamed protein product [Symbiodinium sp. KB8]|nr:unnamed protein product [Symbiodinium sp. KB8]
MRQVFRNPAPFISALQSHIQARGYSGVNIDWEPTKGVTARDALDYAAFLDLLASELHAVGAQVTVDFATWSPIWNLTALAATGVDRFMDMGTYTDSPDSWKRQLQVALQALPHGKIVVGLETTMASSGAPYPVSVLQQRFQLLREAGLDAVGLWLAPIPASFLPFLRDL